MKIAYCILFHFVSNGFSVRDLKRAVAKFRWQKKTAEEKRHRVACSAAAIMYTYVVRRQMTADDDGAVMMMTMTKATLATRVTRQVPA